jgi:hypothetical protein
MRTATLTSTAVALVFLTLAGSAAALPGYVGLIPNGSAKSCTNCHPGSDSSKLNAFADAFKATHAWSADLAKVDSDGDTQANGLELGDPCGTWVKGGTADRKDNISNPGEPGSKTTDTTPCGGGATSTTGAATTGAATTGVTTGATTGGGTEDPGTGPGYGQPKPAVTTGACASIAPVGTGGALGALWLAFGAMALRRRLQRKG